MKISKTSLKEILKNIMKEESEYQTFFKKALDKAGKDIPSMSDDEKKEFFNKIDAAWNAKGEKNEGNAFGAAVVAAKKAGEDEFEVGGKTYKVEESNDCGCGSTNKSVNEGRKSKDGWGVRLVIAIANNVDAIVELVMDDKRDPKEVMSAFANPLLNSVKGVSKHNYKPNAKPAYTLKRDLQRYGDLTNQQRLDIFKSEIKKFEKIVEALIKKPTKVGVKQLGDAWRTIWNHKYGANIALNGEGPHDNTIIEVASNTNNESVNEGNVKLPSSAKKFWNTPIRNLLGYGLDIYYKVPPSQWNTHPEIIDGYGRDAGVDIFKGIIRDLTDGSGHLNPKIAKAIGLPTNVSIIDYLNDGGSGLNGNKNFKKYGNWFSALYDIYDEMEKKFGKMKPQPISEADNDEKYVVIAFHEKGGGFVMTRPSSKKDAEDSARSITKSSDITKQKAVKVSDARKISGLVGKEYLNESVNEAEYKVGDTITVIGKDGKNYKGKVEKLNPLKLRTDSTSTVVLPNPLIKKVVKESINEDVALSRLNSIQDAREQMISFISYKMANGENKPDSWYDRTEKSLSKKSYKDLEKLYLKLGGKKIKIESINEDNGNLMRIGSTMMVGGDGSGMIKPAKMKLISIDYLPREKDYSYKFKGGGRIQYYMGSTLAKKLKGESISVNEISAYSGLTNVSKGQTSNVEGVKISKAMADEILNWMSGSPYAKRYKAQIMKQRLGALLPIIFGPFGIEKKLPSNLKGEFTTLKNKYSTNEGKADGGKMAKTHVIYQMNVKLTDNATVPGFRVSVKKGSDAEKRAKDLAKKHFGNEFKSIVSMSKALNPEINNVSEVVTEGRAFINAAKKAKAEGKTEFEFNGKTYPVTIKD